MTTETRRREWWLEHEDSFWIYATEAGFVEVTNTTPRPTQVRIPNCPEYDAFMFLHEYGWAVADGVTGCLLADREEGNTSRTASHRHFSATPELAIERAAKRLEQIGLDWRMQREHLTERVARCGLSPRYRWGDEEAECPIS